MIQKSVITKIGKVEENVAIGWGFTNGDIGQYIDINNPENNKYGGYTINELKEIADASSVQ